MASEFLYVLGAAVAIFILGGVIAGLSTPAGLSDDGDIGQMIYTAEPGTIGDSQITSRVVSIGDLTVEAGEPNSTVRSVERVEVSSSSDPGSEVIEFQAVEPRRAYISFILPEEASSDGLSIKLNGEEIGMAEYPAAQRVTLSSEEVKEGSNVLEVEAADTGLKFWKTRRYTLENLDIIVNDAANVKVRRPFSVGSAVVEGFSRGEISFLISEDVVRDIPLSVSINGDKIMERPLIKRALPYSGTFFANTTGITAGENVLSLSTSGQSVYPVSNVEMVFYYYAGTEVSTVSRNFELSSSQYQNVKDDGGVLQVTVDRTILPNPVTVEISNRTYERELGAGVNTFEFGHEDVVTGTNEVSLTTDGAYQVSNLTVSSAG